MLNWKTLTIAISVVCLFAAPSNSSQLKKTGTSTKSSVTTGNASKAATTSQSKDRNRTNYNYRPDNSYSDIRLKHDIVLLGHLNNGLGYYRFSYNGSDRAYVGVMAQEVLTVMPDAVVRGRDGFLRVFYDKLGIKFQTYEQWIASGARMPQS